MYIAIEGNKAYVILKETNPETKYGGALTFDIDEDGKPVLTETRLEMPNPLCVVAK